MDKRINTRDKGVFGKKLMVEWLISSKMASKSLFYGSDLAL